MAQPTAYSSVHEPMVVFGETEWGGFEFDPDLVVEEVHLGSSGVPTRASGRVFTGEVRSAVPGQAPIRPRLSRFDLERRYPPYRRFAVGLDHFDPGQRTYLALGYLSKRGVHFGAIPGNAFWNETWQLESLMGREEMAPDRIRQGQLRVTEELAIALEPGWWDMNTFDAIDAVELIGPLDAVKRVQVERLCFNPEGRPNRFRRPAAMTYPGKFGEEDVSVEIYVFDDPDSPRA